MNGLLNGLVEYWQPDVSLGSLKGMVASLDFSTSPSISVVVNAGFPSGRGVQMNAASQLYIDTASDPVLEGWGQTEDFAGFMWWLLPAFPTGEESIRFDVGMNFKDGFEMYTNNDIDIPETQNVWGLLPNGFPEVDSLVQYPNGVPHAQLFWWTLSDLTLHLQVDGGVEYTQIAPMGAGDPDPVNGAHVGFGGWGGLTQIGDCCAWKGDAAVANVLTQRTALFAGTPFSQFDNGTAAIPQRAGSGQYAIRTH